MTQCEKIIILSVAMAACALPMLVGAETFSSLSQLPGFDSAADESGSFTNFINTIYRMSIGFGAALAVLVILFEGIKYSLSDSFGVKAELKGKITMALGGLALLMGAFIFLEFINPSLTNLTIRSLGSIQFNAEDYKAITIGEVTFQSGLTGAEAVQQVQNPTADQYEQMFGRPASPSRIVNGTIQLTPQEIQEFLQSFNSLNSLGVESSNGIHIEGTPLQTTTIDVSVRGQQAVAAAIVALCPAIPTSWAGSAALYEVMGRESGGQVGRPNYALKSYMDANNVSMLRLRQDIRLNRFYSTHCCRVSTQSNREAQENGTARCSPDLQSGLMDHTRAQAQAGTNGYSHISGQCASAAGIGQLINVNMRTYQPSGVQGYGDAAEEICGMLNYIRSRHGTPEGALANYQNGIGY